MLTECIHIKLAIALYTTALTARAYKVHESTPTPAHKHTPAPAAGFR